MGRRVVITGLGAISPVGNDVASSWKSILEGKSGIDTIKSFDASDFDTQFAGEIKGFEPEKYMDRKELKRTDRFVHLAVAASTMAMQDAGLDVTDPAEQERFGVIIGSGIGGIETHQVQHSRYINGGPGRISPFYVPMMISDMAAGYVSIHVKARGPNFCTVSACASAGHAVGMAFRSIKYGESDIMLTGGTEASITQMGLGGFCACKALSTRNDDPQGASRPFDATRDGFVLGDGAGVVVLEEYERAAARGARIYAEITGVGNTADAYHITAPVPGGDGAARAMKAAIEESRTPFDQVDYINAHGTSTEHNDATETLAIKSVFGAHATNGLVVSSTKSMTGHLLGAAGGIEAIFTALAIYYGIVPPTINYKHPDPACDLDYCPNQARRLNIRSALSNSFGFGGHNVTLAFRKV
ncbi:MAG TPA: beta-ketoacyl-ACP synthase II [Candidatus Glassbacteria bacterium]|nr:beta-ketoacyl-ACP synthase II [Candidatus Glassbacteria bacterium]